MRKVGELTAIGVLGVALSGCGGGDSDTPRLATSAQTSPTAETPAPQDPILQTADAFLGAVVDGDSPRAMRLLTPAAVAQFEASGQAFASPEIGAPEFRLGEARQLDDTKAAVQCTLVDGEDEAELCCLLKKTPVGWRVSGVVYQSAPDRQPVIVNFEQPTPPSAGDPRFAEQAPATPVRTAAETPAGSVR